MDLVSLAASPEAWAALATLIVMEVVLGIDNLLFISVITNKLPEANRPAARRLGIGLALVLRLALLASVAWIATLSEPVLSLFGAEFSWRDLILIAGGLFLVWKATTEIHDQVEPEGATFFGGRAAQLTMSAAVVQILMLDAVFSIDSILTAVGMTPHLPIMVIAVVVAVLAMLFAAGPLARFVEANPSVTMLALGFLLMIGTMLVAEGFGVHVPRGYIYAAMAFSALVETLNILRRRRRAREGQPAGD
jgi:predicted tellurium resistance membrane protein TerC